jgi:hypothetical protein
LSSTFFTHKYHPSITKRDKLCAAVSVDFADMPKRLVNLVFMPNGVAHSGYLEAACKSLAAELMPTQVKERKKQGTRYFSQPL